VESLIAEFNMIILQAASCMKKTVKYMRGQHRQARWFDTDCKTMKRELRKHPRKYRKYMKEIDKEPYFDLRKKYKTFLKLKKSEYNSRIFRSLSDSMTNSKIFWKIVRSINTTTTDICSIKQEQWFDHFKNIFQNTAQDNFVTYPLMPEGEDAILDCEITAREITEAIHHLKRGKSPGPDCVTADMLKSSEHLIHPFLYKLFNKLFYLAHHPKQWSESTIVYSFKGGSSNDLNHYRPISLTSLTSKACMYVMNQRIQRWCSHNNVLHEDQAGFRSGYSTFDNMFTLFGVIQKYLGRNKKLYVAYVDFAKAFDSVRRPKLWDALYRIGIRGRMFRMLRAVYSEVSARVRTQHDLSDPFECPQGLKQGCLASPGLFNLLVNELICTIKQKGKHGVQLTPDCVLYTLFFADDVILLADTPVGLQNQLSVLHTSADELGLQINFSKTKVVVYRKGGYLSKHEKWNIDSHPVNVANSYKYLGLHFSTKLSIKYALRELAMKGRAGTMQIIKGLMKVNCLQPKLLFKLFDSQIRPMLLYGAEIWGLQDTQVVESVHLLACKKLLNVAARTPNTMVYGDTGRLPLFIYAHCRCIKFWTRLVKLSDTRYPKKVYRMLLNEHRNGKRNWVSHIENILARYGFRYIWEAQDKVGKSFLKTFKDRLTSCYKQEWHAQICASQRYNVYVHFKEDLRLESYLSLDINSIFKHAFTRIRFGISDLNVHKYRYHPNYARMSLCPFCQDTLEDEIHFFFHCPTYDTIRKKYIRSVFFDQSVLYRVLSAGGSEKESKKTIKFCYFSLKWRKVCITRISTG